MYLEKYLTLFRNPIEDELHKWIDTISQIHLQGLKSILAYHLGWEGEDSGPEAQGKRIRPLLLLLCTEAAGGDWRTALPAAASVELAHNFSLIHDDIQDKSVIRRGRKTVWVKWGVAQAINTGDLMFTLANRAMVSLHDRLPTNIVKDSYMLFLLTCTRLTSGQYLDISYETRAVTSIDDYFKMVSGKTAALISATAELGAIISAAGYDKQQALREFGEFLGLAYQVHDDYLGIWGRSRKTGKSTQGDILQKKKTLPILLGLEKSREFAFHWSKPTLVPREIDEMVALLEQIGAKEYTKEKEVLLTRDAMESLEKGSIKNEAYLAILELVDTLLLRAN
jgi:geranylgeranyl diphosphate synthase, type I